MALASRQGRPDAPRLTRGVLNSLGFEDSPGSLPGRGPRHVIFKELLACITCLNSIRFSRFRRERLRSACRLPPLGLISGARKYITLAPPPRQPPISEFPKKVSVNSRSQRWTRPRDPVSTSASGQAICTGARRYTMRLAAVRQGRISSFRNFSARSPERQHTGARGRQSVPRTVIAGRTDES